MVFNITANIDCFKIGSSDFPSLNRITRDLEVNRMAHTLLKAKRLFIFCLFSMAALRVILLISMRFQINWY